MGREVRRVPPNWEHPRQDCEHSPWNGGCDEAKRNGKCFHPLYDEDAESAFQEWLTELEKWKATELVRVKAEYPDQKYSLDAPYASFCDWHGTPPDPKYYRPRWDEGQATWFQLYETVSEGTPVSPPFATEEELATYLAENGDYWYQREQASPNPTSWRTKPTIEQARRLVGTGWAPSGMIITSEMGSSGFLDAYQQQDAKA